MKINIIIFIILLSVLYVNSEKYCNKSINPSSPEDCYLKLSEEETQNGIKYCCYLIIDDIISCQGLTQEEYEDIPSNVIIASSNMFYYRIECFSYYISLGIINFISFFLL